MGLREQVLFPRMRLPRIIGREKSINGIRYALENDKEVLFLTQKNTEESPTISDFYSIGTVAKILESLNSEDGSIKIIAEGFARVKVINLSDNGRFLQADFEVVSEIVEVDQTLKALIKSAISSFEKYIKATKKTPIEALIVISKEEDPGVIADMIAINLTSIRYETQMQLLELVNPKQRLGKLIEVINAELEILEIEDRIQNQVKKQVEKSQKEFYLNERMKAIQKELGRGDESGEIEELKEKIKAAKMTQEAEEKALKELERLEQMPPMSAEASVIRNYIDWLITLPWSISTESKIDIDGSERILNEDHYGLQKVKERILEYLAVLKLVDKLKGPILCFVGPPGVGKTSLAKSIARATGRNFVRMSLGGVRDEAEIRGHRRTYIGSMPGRIIQSVKDAKSKNPLFLLDEVDKMSIDFRGDPSAALLEVLDPEQNDTFRDHYLDVAFDLSNVMFITTANVLHLIPPPLRDRIEVIELPGYTEYEKEKIAELFLIPKQLKAHGLKPESLLISRSAILDIIRFYTREAGVRNLEREITSICRKVAKKIVKERKEGQELEKLVQITSRNVKKYVGVPKYSHGKAEGKDEIGVATALLWTQVGGDITSVEAITVNGRGRLVLTGQLGDVMRESASAALSYIRSKTSELKLSPDFYRKQDIHIHVPEGAVPKDGPSAGVTMATAMVSALTKCPVRKDVAMTGEITLRGKVLPIGGLKEKVLAAHRAGIKNIIIPSDNEKDLNEIPLEIRKELSFYRVDSMDKVLEVALKSQN